jgi:hypothetical protein
MKRVGQAVLTLVAAMTLACSAHAQGPAAPDAAELTKLVNDFLAGASRNDVAMHDRFWADDLIYTGSTGRRVSKADILRDLRNAAPPKPGEPATVFSAEDVRIQQYGETAVVAFRLVGATQRDGAADRSLFHNTGTFRKRDGQWRAVAWQATRLPRTEEQARAEVRAAATAFFLGVLAADPLKLTAAADEGFIWTHRGGEQQPRKQLLDELGSGQLKYSKLETRNTTIAVYGDAAVVRGVYSRVRSAIPGAAAGDPGPLDTFYTLTMAYRGGAWRAVALHTSRP